MAHSFFLVIICRPLTVHIPGRMICYDICIKKMDKLGRISISSVFLFVVIILGDPEVTANLQCNFAYLYWEGCVNYSIYLRLFALIYGTPRRFCQHTCLNVTFATICIFPCLQDLDFQFSIV